MDNKIKVVVTGSFIDKYTGEIRDIGSTFECSEDRLKEIQSVSSDFVRVAKEAPVETPVKEEPVAEEPAKKTRKRTTKKGE